LYIEEFGFVTLDLDITSELLCLLGHVAHNFNNINKFGTASRSHHNDDCHSDLEHCAHGGSRRKFGVTLGTATFPKGFNQS